MTELWQEKFMITRVYRFKVNMTTVGQFQDRSLIPGL